MMNGKPQTLKQVNLSTVRKAIKEKASATRAEVVAATKISTTTVRSLLREMLENGEVIEAGHDDSSGGRRALRYALNKERFYGVALCLGKETTHYLLVNICGDICESGHIAAHGDDMEPIYSVLDRITREKEIRSIGIGVPGVVYGLAYQKRADDGRLESHPIGELIGRRYGVPVLLENDLNAITLGVGRCHQNQFPDEDEENTQMAFLHFAKGCISAGFLAGGRLLRGWSHFAGELGLFPMEDARTLDDVLDGDLEGGQYARIVASLVAGVCCVLNPRYVVLGGDSFRKSCLPLVTDAFYGLLPDGMAAEILYAEDTRRDYFEGMAHLTAEHIFSDIVLVREK